MIAKLLQAKPIRARKNLTDTKQGCGLRIRGKFKYFCSIEALRRHFDSNFRKVHIKVIVQNITFMKRFRNKIVMPCRGKGQY